MYGLINGRVMLRKNSVKDENAFQIQELTPQQDTGWLMKLTMLGSPPRLGQIRSPVSYTLWRLRLPQINLVSAIVTASTFMAAGCGAGYVVVPDRTTYPRGSIRQEQAKMSMSPQELGAGVGIQAGDFSHQSVMQGRPFLEFERTVIGDSAAHEIRIVPNVASARNEASMRAKVPEVARRICGPRYRITSSKYYNGTEGTSGFLGISHPWFKVEVRCPLDLHTKDDSVAELITSVSQVVPEADYFDIHLSMDLETWGEGIKRNWKECIPINN